MKIIERYFAKQFIISFSWTLTAFVLFYLIFDFFSRLNLIIDGTIPPAMVADYYFSMVPLVFVTICPVAALLATLYTLANLSKSNEMIAAVGCGKHPYSIFAVFLLLGLLISFASMWINEQNVPEAARRAHAIRYSSREDELQGEWKNRVLYGSGNRRFFIKHLDASDNTFKNFEITQFSPDGSEIMKFQAREGSYDDGAWSFSNIVLRTFEPDGSPKITVYADSASADSRSWEAADGTIFTAGRQSRAFEKMPLEIQGISETTADFIGYRLRYDEMNFAQLREYVLRLTEAGFHPRQEIIALHSKITIPLASFVLMLIGIPLAVRQRRGGVMIGFGAALGIALCYYLAMSLGNLLGEFLIPPAAGAWLPSVLFSAPGFYFLLKARYISYG